MKSLIAVLSVYIYTVNGFSTRILPENLYRNKRGGTTVCVEIKPNGAGNNEPYFMCKGSQFPQRQQNIPSFIKANENHYQSGIHNPNYQHQFKNMQQPHYTNIETNYHQSLPMGHSYYSTPNLVNQFPTTKQFQQQDHHIPSSVTNYDAFSSNQNYETKSSSANPTMLVNQFPTIEQFQQQDHHIPSSVTNSDAFSSNQNYETKSSIANPTMLVNQLPTTKQLQQQDHHIPSSVTNSAAFSSNQNYETKSSNAEPTSNKRDDLVPNLIPSKTLPIQSLFESTKNINHSKDNFESQQPSRNINYNSYPAHYNALIEDEVLGAPNLEYSPEEMLSLHNMYRDDPNKGDLVGTTQTYGNQRQSYVPPDYLHDPILRTFYNIDETLPGTPPNSFQQMPVMNREYVNKPLQHTNGCSPNLSPSALAFPVLTQPSYPQHGSRSYMERLQNPYSGYDSPCGNLPFSYQPIFIAVPWFAFQYYDVLTNSLPVCGQPQSSYESRSLNLGQSICGQTQSVYEGGPIQPYSGQPNLGQTILGQTSLENPIESLNNPQPIVTSKSENNQYMKTEATTDSSEDLSTEEPEKSDNDSKIENSKLGITPQFPESETEDEKAEDDDSTTTIPTTTTPKTFKTMMHTAKMHAQMAYAPHRDSLSTPNKRQTPNYGSGNPTNYKKQYVRKLERINI